MEDIADSIVQEEGKFFVPSYGDLGTHLNKYGDVVIEQNGTTIIIKRGDFADMEKYLRIEWALLDECEQ